MIGELVPGYRQVAVLVVCFAAVGLVQLWRARSPLLLIPAWALLHTLGYTLLRIAYPFAWYYAPVIACVLILAGLGSAALITLAGQWWTARRYAPALVLGAITGLCVVGIALFSYRATWDFVTTFEDAYYAGARDQVYRQVGRWLAEHSEPQAAVALTEVGTIGYFSDRRIIDLMGLVTYDLRDLPKQGNFAETIDSLRPGYVIGVKGLPPDPDLVGFAGYQAVMRFPKGDDNLFEEVVVYQLVE